MSNCMHLLSGKSAAARQDHVSAMHANCAKRGRRTKVLGIYTLCYCDANDIISFHPEPKRLGNIDYGADVDEDFGNEPVVLRSRES